MKEHHSSNGEFFVHRHTGVVDYHPTENCTTFNLIDAFNKKFVFLYTSRAENSIVMFIIYLLGRKIDAKKYMIDFELRDDEMRKVKLIEMCYSDADDIINIAKDHRCIVLSKKLVESYVKNDKLEFRFVIKKKDFIEMENIEKQEHLLHSILNSETEQATKQNGSKTQMKTYQSESNIFLSTARNTGSAKQNKRYYRNSKK